LLGFLPPAVETAATRTKSPFVDSEIRGGIIYLIPHLIPPIDNAIFGKSSWKIKVLLYLYAELTEYPL
jgi:hypothetical protein